MKTCFKCNEMKPSDAFYRHPYMSDGRLGKCIECAKLDVRKNRRECGERVRAYDRLRAKDPDRRECNAERNARLRRADPRKYSARLMVHRAVKSGRLIKQPCEVCGEARSVAHHDDYGKPLDVRWLCQLHHMRHHFAKDVDR